MPGRYPEFLPEKLTGIPRNLDCAATRLQFSVALRCDTLAMAMLHTSLLRHQPEREESEPDATGW